MFSRWTSSNQGFHSLAGSLKEICLELNRIFSSKTNQSLFQSDIVSRLIGFLPLRITVTYVYLGVGMSHWLQTQWSVNGGEHRTKHSKRCQENSVVRFFPFILRSVARSIHPPLNFSLKSRRVVVIPGALITKFAHIKWRTWKPLDKQKASRCPKSRG